MVASNPNSVPPADAPSGAVSGTAAGDMPGELRPVFAATITPHRSLTPAGFRLVMTLVCIVVVVSTVPFALMGAWPVLGFGGLDIIALYIAFRVNFRAGRGVEEVIITPVELLLRRITPKARNEWRFNPLWTRLERTESEDFGVERLAFVCRDQRVVVGAWLSPLERATLGVAIQDALAEVRRGPR